MHSWFYVIIIIAIVTNVIITMLLIIYIYSHTYVYACIRTHTYSTPGEAPERPNLDHRELIYQATSVLARMAMPLGYSTSPEHLLK